MKATDYPGMVPQLENSELIHGFHTMVIADILRDLVPKLPDRYLGYIETTVVLESVEDRTYRVPDVHVSLAGEPAMEYAGIIRPAPTFTLDAVEELERKVRTLQLRDADNNLITTIELLSPTNKSGRGFEAFKTKQEALFRAGVNLVEIDLLQPGKRRFWDSRIADTPYVITVSRSSTRKIDVWTFTPNDPIPNPPIPLLPEDEDVTLDLQKVVRSTFEGGAFARKLAHEATKKK